MRFLFFTDSHIRGTNPVNRKDDFYQTLKNKFEEIRQLCIEFDVDFVLHGGDWFDRPDVSPSVVRDFAVIIRNFQKTIYTVAGNHDLFGQNPETVGRTMVGLLEGAGLVKLLNPGKVVLLEKDSFRVQLTGSHYRYDIDGDRYKDFYIVKKDKSSDYAINIIHGMLLNKPFIEGVQYTLIKDIVGTEADITLSGHYHSGYGIIKMGEKYFINPGSLVRISNTMSEIKRMPRVIIINIGNNLSVEEVKLKTALPGEEVLDRSKIEKSLFRDKKLQYFSQELENSCEYRRIDLKSIINEIAKNNNVETSVKEEAIRRIAAAREAFPLENS